MMTTVQLENFAFIINLVALVGLGVLAIRRPRGGVFSLDFDSGDDYADSSSAGGLAITFVIILLFIAVGAGFAWKWWGWQVHAVDLACLILMFFARQKIKEE